MKLPDFLLFAPFNELRKKMKAELLETNEFKQDLSTLSLAELQIMQHEGLDIDINDIEILEDGTLKYKDRRILIYIRDWNSYNRPGSMPRFHFANCKTYQEMKHNGRGNRYVASLKTDGYFNLNIMSDYEYKNMDCKLLVCKNCLSHINYNGYSSNKNNVFENFSLKEYFEQYPADFLAEPQYTNATSPLNQYSLDWNQISTTKRKKDNYICDKCHVIVGEKYSKYLQVHHVNGLKYDNSEDNLETLCYKCHAEEPLHGHMKNNPLYAEFMEIYPQLNKIR